MSEFITLLNGDKISTATGELVPNTELVQANQDASDIMSADPELLAFMQGPEARTIDDVTIDHRPFRVMLAVFSAAAWGLKPHDIATLLDAEIDQVNAVLEDEKYNELSEQIFESLKRAMRENVDGVLVNSALDAALVLRQQLTSRSDDAKRLAAKDILDRTGFKSADTVNLKMEDEFVIRIIEEKSNSEVIDL